MDPVAVAVTESEAEVMAPEGVGWGLVFEEPPPGEPEGSDEEPQPCNREDAVRASAP